MWLLIISGNIEEILRPKEFFDSNPGDLDEVVKVVRAGFGRALEFQDIYEHVTNPERVYLLRNGEIKAMASYNEKVFCGIPSLIVEGISLAPEVQGKGIFRILTEQATGSNKLILLRTQNPRMYRALENFCNRVYPRQKKSCEDMDDLVIELADQIGSRRVLNEFADYLGCKIDKNSVVKGYYGGLFYGKEPTHPIFSKFFKQDLGMDLYKGDAMLAVGIIQGPPKIRESERSGDFGCIAGFFD